MDRPRNLARVLTMCLGALWLLDGILQLQPAMFTRAFVDTVLAPNLQNQPGIIAAIVAFGIRIFSTNIFWFNLASALIQILIGIFLLVPSGNRTRRFWLWLSVVWAAIVWIFGEGFGGLATGMATFYTGAPGSALLYLIIAIFLLSSLEKKLPLAAGILFLIGAALNLAPMFWQPGMLSMLTMGAPMGAGALGAIGSQGTMLGNFLAVDALAFLGIFLIFSPNRPAAWVAILFLLLVWWLSQDFGGLATFPGGTATDPNSAPLLIVFLLPIFFADGGNATNGARPRNS